MNNMLANTNDAITGSKKTFFKKRYQVLAVLCLLAIITYLDRTAASVAEHGITDSFQLTEKQFGWLHAVFSIAYGLFQIPSGWIGDKFGAKKVLLFIVLWWSGFTLLTGLSATFTAMLVIRFLFAAGEAGAFPNISIAISKWFPATERARAQSFVWMCTRMGGALAPVIIIPVMDQWGWHMVFYSFGVIGIAWALLWYFFFREEPAQMPGISNEELIEIESSRRLKKSHGLLSFRKLASDRNLWAIMLMYCLYMFGAYFYLSWLPKYLRQGRGFDMKQSGFIALPFILGALGCLLGGFSTDYLCKKIGVRWGRRSVAFTGLLLAGLCIIGAALSPGNMGCIAFLSAGLFFKDFTLPVSWTVSADIGGKHAGAITGSMHMFGQIGSTLMSLGFGYVVQETGNWNLPMIGIGILVLCSGLLWLCIDATKSIEE
ncbi:MFS transporter [Sediminibacterium soli]|uniref:MFS transporter n=1 Tax=Sediminibacterium soli TaxID=2698829 RepID=UPI00137AC14A|nr:MFS transporter [Sediminibacterium soli]NCI48140.1 MFS transporter [Sediminibacterium soli]